MIQVRRSTYRRRDGWLVCGYPPSDSQARGWPVSIFTESEEQARYIADKVRAGESWSFSDDPETENA